MAYFSSTEATTVSNPPRLIASPLANFQTTGTGLTTAPTAGPNGQGGQLWYYCSTNLTTDVNAAGFFTDGEKLGMNPGDIVLNVQFSSAGSSVQLLVGVINALSTAGAATMSTGASLTSTFN